MLKMLTGHQSGHSKQEDEAKQDPIGCVVSATVWTEQVIGRENSGTRLGKGITCQCPAVVCCHSSPTQKAPIVRLLKQHTANRTYAIWAVLSASLIIW